MSSKILVTGGCGFIGRVVVRELESLGHRLTVVDRNVSGDTLPAHLIQADYAEYATTTRDQYDHVVHLAASHEVGRSVREPGEFYHNNVTGTVALLEAMKRGLASSIIFSSSGGVYGQPTGSDPIKETDSTRPVNPYGSTKLACELAIGDYVRSFGLRATVFRYFNAAGADPLGRSGYVQDPASHAIPILLRAINEGRPFTIFGENYPTPDGSAVRDYVHVHDLARAHALAIGQLNLGWNGGTFNLGQGRGVSLKELTTQAFDVIGRQTRVVLGEPREGDPAFLVADVTMAQRQLGWVPHYDLSDILKHGWNWETR